jgi:hypothetical protein
MIGGKESPTMDRFSKFTRLMFSVASLLVAVSIFVFVVKYEPGTARGLTTLGMDTAQRSFVYTQSQDGKTLYQWVYVMGQKKWMRKQFTTPVPGDPR